MLVDKACFLILLILHCLSLQIIILCTFQALSLSTQSEMNCRSSEEYPENRNNFIYNAFCFPCTKKQRDMINSNVLTPTNLSVYPDSHEKSEGQSLFQIYHAGFKRISLKELIYYDKQIFCYKCIETIGPFIIFQGNKLCLE